MSLRVFLAGAVGALALAMAVSPAAAAPGDTIYGITSDNTIISFSPTNPGAAGAGVAISGLAGGERILGIDVRPANNKLYGISSASQLYEINTTTGVATKVGSTLATAIEGGFAGFDFNPAVDRIRLVTDQGQNLRLHPDTGAIAATDGRIAFKAGDLNADGYQPTILASAYTNADNDPATATTLFNIDTAHAALVTQNPPNDGTLNTVGPLGIDTSAELAFDIGPGGAFLASQPMADAPSRLYKVDLGTGAATEVGAIGSGVVVTGIAIKLEAAPAPPTTPTASPTATGTPPRAPGPPNTGSGIENGGADVAPWLAAGVALVVGAAGASLAVARRRS